MSVDIVLNGESLTLPANSTLAECLMQQAFLPANWLQATADIKLSFVVAVNQHVVRWQDWSSIRLASGDAVDVLGAITGG